LVTVPLLLLLPLLFLLLLLLPVMLFHLQRIIHDPGIALGFMACCDRLPRRLTLQLVTALPCHRGSDCATFLHVGAAGKHDML
jgi:hypothetical protein